jgi:hypothetical protein
MDRGLLYVSIETTIGKKSNVGTVLRCAVALGASALIVVGNKTFATHGAHGAQCYLPIIHFYTWQEVKEFSASNMCSIYGLVSPLYTEDRAPPKTATSLDIITFAANAVFMIGDKYCQLTDSQISVADELIYVDFPGGPKLGSLLTRDLQLSICLNRFAACHHFEQVRFEEEKFCVPDRKVSNRKVARVKKEADYVSEDCVDAGALFSQSVEDY